MEGWKPMELPAQLEQTVAGMENENFVVNVRYTPDSVAATGELEPDRIGREEHQ
jgi:hypothetical protein